MAYWGSKVCRGFESWFWLLRAKDGFRGFSGSCEPGRAGVREGPGFRV